MAEADKPTGEESRRERARTGDASRSFGDYDDVLRLILELSKDPKTAPIADSVANTLLTVIGSGPSFAAMQSMVAANQANGLMYHNAVANQQMTNVVAMVATMNCVQVLLDKPPTIPWPDIPGHHPSEDRDDHG